MYSYLRLQHHTESIIQGCQLPTVFKLCLKYVSHEHEGRQLPSSPSFMFSRNGFSSFWLYPAIQGRKQIHFISVLLKSFIIFSYFTAASTRLTQLTRSNNQLAGYHLTILGPLLLILFINDLHLPVNDRKVHHFPDDTNLLFSNKSLKKINSSINYKLALLIPWLRANRSSFNATKTEFFIFRPKQKL